MKGLCCLHVRNHVFRVFCEFEFSRCMGSWVDVSVYRNCNCNIPPHSATRMPCQAKRNRNRHSSDTEPPLRNQIHALVDGDDIDVLVLQRIAEDDTADTT